MKQARCWLLIAAAMLLPQAAYAQPKKPGAKPPATAPQASADGASRPAVQAVTSAISMRPKPQVADTGATAVRPPAATRARAATGSSGGICEIDPSACPKAGGHQALAAKKDVHAEVYAVQQIYALRRHRFELMPYWGFTLNDQFVSHPGPGLGVNYYITNVLAIGLNGNFYQPFNGDSDFNFQKRRATRVAVPLTEYLERRHAELHVRPDVRKVRRLQPVHLPLRRLRRRRRRRSPHASDAGHRPGQPQVRLRAEGRVHARHRPPHLPEPLVRGHRRDPRLHLRRAAREHRRSRPTQAAAARSRTTWFGEKPLTNNVQAQLGISIFLPFSWEYRLPK